MILGVLLGLVFSVLALPFSFHESADTELRGGIMFGIIGNIFFAFFIGVTGLV